MTKKTLNEDTDEFGIPGDSGPPEAGVDFGDLSINLELMEPGSTFDINDRFKVKRDDDGHYVLCDLEHGEEIDYENDIDGLIDDLKVEIEGGPMESPEPSEPTNVPVGQGSFETDNLGGGLGETVTFKNGPGYKKALEILDSIPDEDLKDKKAVADTLRQAGLMTQADDIDTMSDAEYEDFIVNNLGESSALDEKASKEIRSFNTELLAHIKKALQSMPGARIIKASYNASGVQAEILYKEPNGKVRHYDLTLKKQYGVTPDLPEKF